MANAAMISEILGKTVFVYAFFIQFAQSSTTNHGSCFCLQAWHRSSRLVIRPDQLLRASLALL